MSKEENGFVIEGDVLVKYIGNATKIQIPSSVKKIAKEAFNGSQIEEVTFSDGSLQIIEEHAFSGCTKLEYIELPNGLIKIGESAFYRCTSMKCAAVPSSVLVIENDAFAMCEFEFFILGSKGTEAEAYASKNSLLFKTDKYALNAIKRAKRKRTELERRTFDIFGENVVCSNSLPLYHRVVTRYNTIRDGEIKKMVSFLPTSVRKGTNGDLKGMVDKLVEKSAKELQHEGAVIDDRYAWLEIIEDFKQLCSSSGDVISLANSLRKAVAQNVEIKVDNLNRQVERSVTGLGYGVVGDTLDLIIHDIGEYEARAEQRAKATAIANSQLSEYKNQQWEEAQRIFKREMDKQLPTIREKAKSIIDKLMNWELNTLSKAGLLDLESAKNLDFEKSKELYNSSFEKGKDERMLLAFALKKYPYNVDAIGKAVAKGYTSDGLTELIKFLDVDDAVKKRAEKERRGYISGLENLVKNNSSLNKALDVYTKHRDGLDNNERQILLDHITNNTSNKVSSLLSSGNELYGADVVQDFANSKMDNIITVSQWDYLVSQGAKPVSLSGIPDDVQSDRLALIAHIATVLSETKNDKETKLAEAKEKLNNAKTLGEYEAAREMFVKLDGYGTSASIIKTEIDVVIIKLKCDAIINDLGHSKNREKLLTAKNELGKFGDYAPAKEKIAEIEVLLKKDTKKRIILGIAAAVFVVIFGVVWHFVLNPIIMKNSGDFNTYKEYILSYEVEEFEIPEGTTEIPDYAFSGCNTLRTITIPSSVTSIGKDAFDGCGEISAVHISDIAKWCEIDFAEGTFYTPNDYGVSLYLNGQVITDLVIPDGVTKISDFAFDGFVYLKSVKVADSVEIIGEYAFFNCDALEKVTLGENLKTIEESAFYHCGKLSEVNIPRSVSKIGEGAFHHTDVDNLYIADVEQWIRLNATESVLNWSLKGEVKHNLYLNSQLVTDLVIPGSVGEVNEAFKGCISIKSVTVQEGATKISPRAFNGCNELQSVIIPTTVTEIGEVAFEGCDKLEKITLPFTGKSASSVNEEGHIGYIFGYEVTKNSYSYSGSHYAEKYGDRYTKYYYNIPETLRTVTLTATTSIKNMSFNNCDGLTSIVIPNSVTSIDSSAFSGCTGLTSIVIPNGVTSIGSSAFSGCTNLASITLPDTLINIKSGVFNKTAYYNNEDNWENGVLYIGNYLIEAKDTISGTYTVKDGTILIADGAFAYRDNLTKVILSDSLKYIGYRAFVGCDKFNTIVIGDSLQSIGERAFYYTYNMTINYCGSKSQWDAISKGVEWAPKGYTINYDYTL